MTADTPTTAPEAATGRNERPDSRKCAYCSGSLAGKRSDARFCSNSHRVMWRLRPKPEPRAATWSDADHDERTGRLDDQLNHWTDIGGNEW